MLEAWHSSFITNSRILWFWKQGEMKLGEIGETFDIQNQNFSKTKTNPTIGLLLVIVIYLLLCNLFCLNYLSSSLKASIC